MRIQYTGSYFREKAIRLTTLTLLLAFSFFYAQIAQSADDTPPTPALWKLSDEDSEVYLFGTIHILNPSLHWQSKDMSAAFAKSPVIYFEAPADTSTQQAVQNMQRLIRQHGLNERGVKLSSKLSTEGKQNLKSVLDQFGMSAQANNFEAFRPWLAAVSLASAQIQASGGDPNAGVERILSTAAKQAGKTIKYFETDAQQIAFFGKMSSSAEVKFLEAGLAQMQEDPDMLDDLITVWRKGDVPGMEEELLTAFEQHPELYDTLLTKRNQDWAKTIDTIMDGSGTVFIAVGAAHLVGENSVQALLEQYGHIAERQ